MAAAVSYRLADAVCTRRSPLHPPSSCATGLRINPACVARPEGAAGARNAKRRYQQRGEERPRSPDVKRRRRDDARRRVSPHGRSKRKRENVDDDRSRSRSRRGSSSTSSRSTSFGRPRPETGVLEDHVPRREDARRTAKIKREQEDTTWRRSRSGSAQTRARRPDPYAARQQQLPAPAAVTKPRVFSLDGRPLQDEHTESFEEAKLRRRETQQRREEARRELAKVVQTVFFNVPYISLADVLKP